jgi:hypothetical protein
MAKFSGGLGVYPIKNICGAAVFERFDRKRYDNTVFMLLVVRFNEAFHAAWWGDRFEIISATIVYNGIQYR